ncbi:T-cell surface glycoprotein CD3 epsilon chain-like [Garra rufa]|uniref:T-cell surface glycoprotein CD3 epsilon chain-like n=1 Tax=Garra rufa TaxID=137080 RepID=UPI003CCE7624
MIFMSFMFLLFTVTVNPAQSQGIEIKDNSVILSCSDTDTESVTWSNGKDSIVNKTYEVKAENEKVEGLFSCEYTKTDSVPNEQIKHVFYLRVKVCENCYELNGLLAWGVILGDLMVTGGVILIVYLFATKNSEGTQKKGSGSTEAQ